MTGENRILQQDIKLTMIVTHPFVSMNVFVHVGSLCKIKMQSEFTYSYDIVFYHRFILRNECLGRKILRTNPNSNPLP